MVATEPQYHTAKLDPEVKKLWIEALRSGEFKQGKHRLCNITKEGDLFCCLGVLCEILIKQGVKLEKQEQPPDIIDSSTSVLGYYTYSYKETTKRGSLPIDLKDISLPPQEEYNLTVKNDSGKSFLEIADYIEATL